MKLSDWIKPAADSIGKLRKCDVLRVLDTCTPEVRPALAAWITRKRPDLAEEVRDCIEDITRHIRAYAEATGLPCAAHDDPR